MNKNLLQLHVDTITITLELQKQIYQLNSLLRAENNITTVSQVLKNVGMNDSDRIFCLQLVGLESDIALEGMVADAANAVWEFIKSIGRGIAALFTKLKNLIFRKKEHITERIVEVERVVEVIKEVEKKVEVEKIVNRDVPLNNTSSTTQSKNGTQGPFVTNYPEQKETKTKTSKPKSKPTPKVKSKTVKHIPKFEDIKNKAIKHWPVGVLRDEIVRLFQEDCILFQNLFLKVLEILDMAESKHELPTTEEGIYGEFLRPMYIDGRSGDYGGFIHLHTKFSGFDDNRTHDWKIRGRDSGRSSIFSESRPKTIGDIGFKSLDEIITFCKEVSTSRNDIVVMDTISTLGKRLTNIDTILRKVSYSPAYSVFTAFLKRLPELIDRVKKAIELSVASVEELTTVLEGRA